jgi:hemolysin III
VNPVTTPRPKPRFRGVLHHFGAFVAVGAGAVLVAMAPPGRATLGIAVFVGSLVWMLGVSALYHRPMWPPNTRARLKRLDHGSIFILIAGTYTPVALLALPPAQAQALLTVVWSGAALGLFLTLAWIRRPRLVTTLIYLTLGWVALAYVGPLRAALDAKSAALILAGGVLYSVGALIYALRRPDPVPAVFGYHEVFHALVLLASASHFAAVVLLAQSWQPAL